MQNDSMNGTLSTYRSIEMKNTVFTAVGIVFISLVFAVTVIGDCLIFIGFYFHASVRTRVNSLFLSLATADFLLAVFVMPLELVRLVSEPAWPLGVTVTKLWNSLFVCFGTASVFNLVAISVERYLSITRPLIHHYTIVSKEVLLGIAFVWTFASLNGVYTFLAWKNPDVATAGFSISVEYAIPLLILDVVLPFVICVVAHCSIFRISLEHSHRISLLCGWAFSEHKIRLKREKKSALTLSVLVGTFAVTSLPFFIFHVVDVAYNEQVPYRYYASQVVKWFSYLNSASNWVLYGFLNHDFREVLFSMFKSFYNWICSAKVRCFNQNRVTPLHP